MAYIALPSHVAGDVFPIGDYDKIKGNFEASPIHQVTTKGDLGVGTGSQTMARLAVGADDSTLVADASTSTGLAWQTQPAARVFNSAAIDPATSTWVTLTFNSEQYDTDASHSTVTNTGRLTVPTGGAGLYLIGATIEFDTTTILQEIGARILVNGVTVIAQHLMEAGDNNNVNGRALTISTIWTLNAADFVEVQVFTVADININSSGSYSPHFYYQWLRRQ